MSEEKKDFVVKDRRIFAGDKDQDQDKREKTSEQGKVKEPPAGKAPQEGKTEKQPSQGPPPKGAAAIGKEAEPDTQLPEINFLTFVMSLNASALVNLGLVEDPATNTKVKNLPLAKQTIDMLGMLQDKTRGNLTTDEENLLKHILYELRMIYIKEKE